MNPWFTIWVRPRETIRAYLNSAQSQRGMIWLALAAGYINALDNASSRNMGDKVTGMAQIYGGFGVGGALGGLIFLFVFSWLLKVTGRWLRGQGTTRDLRVAVARGFYMPSVMLGLLWIPQLLLFGKENFTSQTPRMDASPSLSALFSVLGMVYFIGAVWIFVISLKSVAEAHHFSAWRALGCILLMLIIPVAVIFVLVLLFHAI